MKIQLFIDHLSSSGYSQGGQLAEGDTDSLHSSKDEHRNACIDLPFLRLLSKQIQAP